jgi:GNAT superfamily N-acetyltransferase
VGRYLCRPKIDISIYSCKYNLWELFKKHHYLNNKLNKASRCYVGIWNNEIICFSAAITYPSGTVKNAWREHRTVVLPDYQGMGIGTRFSDAIAQIFVDEGKRYFSRTAHPRMGEYRNKSSLWKATSKNKIIRKDIKPEINGSFNNWVVDTRVCYSHEYIGIE